MKQNNYTENSFIEKTAKEWEDTKPTVNDIYHEMGRYKYVHVKSKQRLESIGDILEEIESLIENSDGIEGEAKVFEDNDVALTYEYRINDALMAIMRSFADLIKEIEVCSSMWEHLRGELPELDMTRDYAQERLNIFKKKPNKDDNNGK